ncbi:hypothetical protein [Rhodanobacter sp. Root561]|uniref:hypothetical protein n=1 Tax=Rhodanobacter sp. Root561 TaxID=1736560 RepID=UPI000AFC7D2E|nr:hypothetical protein [Rhodanobacter sp. Root561]
MSNATPRDQSVLAIVAAALLFAALACGQPLAGIAGVTITLAGMAWRRQPAHRKAGTALVFGGFVLVLVAMMFNVGYRLGKDMAHRDHMRETAAHIRLQ